jgi:hypothetical protein
VLDRVRDVAPNARIDFRQRAEPLPGPIGFSQDLAETTLGYRAATGLKGGLARTLAALRAQL